MIEMQHTSRRSRDMIDHIESESEDSDSSIDLHDIDDFSMADGASHFDGSSLDDKLRLAASKGQVEKIPTLLAQGAGFIPDKEGRTAIHYASLSGYSEGVRILAANGCSVNSQDNLGYTALHRAAAQGHIEVVRVLCDCHCNLNVQDDVHGNTALHEAAWNGYSKTVDLLCRSKAAVHLVNKAGFSALHLAAQNGHNQSARSLLYAGCDANHKNNYGDTPLHTAGRYGHAGVTRILLSAKCRLSEQNKNGDSALHIAAALKRKKIAKLLVESNINISLKNKQNETASDVARRKEYPEITLIITSQPKLYKQKKKEDKKRKKEGKVSSIEESDDPRKDKKMTFFFKKRSKSKDKENKENRDLSVDRLESRHQSNLAPFEVRNGSIHSHSSDGRIGDVSKQRASSKEMLAVPRNNPHCMNPQMHGQSKVNGLLTNYEAKTGVQYYRDLAGNIKQGPIGFAPVCNCGQTFKKMERKMEADRNNLHDHIEATQQMISHRMDDMDHTCSHRVQSADRSTRQYVDQNQHMQQARLHQQMLHQQRQTDQRLQLQEHMLRSEYIDYVGRQFNAFEDHYAPLPSRCQGCEYCNYGINEFGNYCYRGVRGGYFRDDYSINPPPSVRTQHLQSVYQQGVGLYRSKSDETLSISSSHPSKRHWKMKGGKSRTIKEFKERHSNKNGDPNKRPQHMNVSYNYHNEFTNSHGVRLNPQGEGATTHNNSLQYNHKPMYFNQNQINSINEGISSGRSPEGQSSNNEYNEHTVDPSSHYNTWDRKRKPAHTDLVHQLEEKQIMQQDFETLTVRDYPQSSLKNNSGSSIPQQKRSGSVLQNNNLSDPHNQSDSIVPQSHSTNQQLSTSVHSTPEMGTSVPYNTPVPGSTPSYNTPNTSYNTTYNSSSRLGSSYVLSPDQIQIHHVKTDSGSNPDSGYSSKSVAYGLRPAISGKSVTNPMQGDSPDIQHHSDQHNPQPMHQSQPSNRFSSFGAYPTPQQTIQQQSGRFDGGSPNKAVNRNRGYASDGCPGMRRPKTDAYASDNCSGMRRPNKQVYKSVLNDWYEQQVSSKGNGVIKEVPSQQNLLNGPSSFSTAQHNVSSRPNQPMDSWPGKATQV